MTAATSPSSLIGSVRVLVCVGTGGVGKTTIAAAIALEAARRGARALVLTIDPARRLADALGVGELDNEPRELPGEIRAELGIGDSGQLFAMMLDMKRTFDDMVSRFADSPETRERILANPIYLHISDALAGSAEYAAMEKVYEMVESGRFDLIVLDTPPSQHALDFLDAPRRLLEFLDSRLVKLLVHPAFSAGRFGFRIFQGTTQRVLKVVERVSGIAFLEDISEFLLAFEGMSEGFAERARHVRSMLLGPEAAFVLVAAPSTETARNAETFLAHLEQTKVPVAGVVVNRTRLWFGGAEPPSDLGLPLEEVDRAAELERDIARLAEALAEGGDDASVAARAAAEAVGGYAELVRRDLESIEPLRARAEASDLFVRMIPELPRDVHDLEGLAAIALHLFGETPATDAPQEPKVSTH